MPLAALHVLVMKHQYLRRMLEWRIERDRGWSEPMDWLGKGLKKRLPPEVWEALEGTYAGAGIEENWEALFRTLALFRRVTVEVTEDLGYAYPHDLDRRVTGYVRAIRGLEPRSAERGSQRPRREAVFGAEGGSLEARVGVKTRAY
jgi:aminoglycoside 6-adenylyltransferase